jgi:hypothetical protein
MEQRATIDPKAAASGSVANQRCKAAHRQAAAVAESTDLKHQLACGAAVAQTIPVQVLT